MQKTDDLRKKIWKNNTYECMLTLKHDDQFNSCLQLRCKEILVLCGHYMSSGVSFWNINDFTEQRIIKEYFASRPTSMIQFIILLSLIFHHIEL